MRCQDFKVTGAADFFGLENPLDRTRLGAPLLALSGLERLVVIAEIRHAPGLFQIRRVPPF